MTDILTVDFETYYDKDFSLSKITTEQYIRDERFEVIGVGVKVDDQPAEWFSGTMAQTKEYLDGFDIPSNNLICHNMVFDGAILAWRMVLAFMGPMFAGGAGMAHDLADQFRQPYLGISQLRNHRRFPQPMVGFHVHLWGGLAQ